MKVFYDPEVDAVHLVLADGPVHESDEVSPGVVLDYDSDGRLLGVEVLDASQRVTAPGSVELLLFSGPDARRAA